MTVQRPRVLVSAAAVGAFLLAAAFPRTLMPSPAVMYGPADQPYGYREYSARDSEGGLWSFMKPLD